MISLAGKAAVITGGSRGIGAAAVKLFAQAGADVVFSYNRSRDAAGQVEQEARKHGTRVEMLKADLSRMADAKKLISVCRRPFGPFGHPGGKRGHLERRGFADRKDGASASGTK